MHVRRVAPLATREAAPAKKVGRRHGAIREDHRCGAKQQVAKQVLADVVPRLGRAASQLQEAAGRVVPLPHAAHVRQLHLVVQVQVARVDLLGAKGAGVALKRAAAAQTAFDEAFEGLLVPAARVPRH